MSQTNLTVGSEVITRVVISEPEYRLTVGEVVQPLTVGEDIQPLTVGEEVITEITVGEDAIHITVGQEDEITALTLTGGGGTSTGGGAVPEYILVQSNFLGEGDWSIDGPVNWNTSRMILKELRVWTLSKDWDLWLVQNGNGLAIDNAGVPALQIMGSGDGTETIFVDRPYADEDGGNQIHLHFLDNLGSATFRASVVGTELI